MPVQSAEGIKSIQRGILTLNANDTSLNVTISAVNTAKTIVKYLGQTTVWGQNADDMARLWLTSSTQLGAVRTLIGSGVKNISYEIIEYW